MPADALLLTCEHGGREVPAGYEHLFAGSEALLRTHLGFDLGAFDLARDLAERLEAPLLASTTTRLAVDLNRSLWNAELFSSFTRGLPEADQERLLEAHYRPHRDAVARAVRAGVERGGRVVHIGVHSFTPVIEGRARRVDIGLLHDDDRRHELAFCKRWQRELRRSLPELRILRNAPYHGAEDGLTTELRSHHPEASYLGLELEVNQALLARPERALGVSAALVDTLRSLLKPAGPGQTPSPLDLRDGDHGTGRRP